METVLVIIGLLIRVAIAFLIVRWGALEAIRHVLKREPELVGRVMLRLLRSARFREELKGLIAEALAVAEADGGGETRE